MKLLSPLPYPVTFVLRYPESWPELFAHSDNLPDPDTLYDRLRTGEDGWIVVTYLHLKRRGLNVSISTEFVPGEICVVNGLDYSISQRSYRSFVVACRGDGYRPELSDLNIVQGRAMLQSPKDYLIYLWTQPGLIPRDRSRGTRIETLSFKGWVAANLYEPLRSAEFRAALADLGVTLEIKGLWEDGPSTFHDFSTSDLVIAARDLTEQDVLVKPPNKLINAWAAGVPALLGPEPGFQDLRQSELDYIEIRTPEETLDAIRRLKQSPELYEQMVANGLKRAEEFTADRQCDRWHDFLSGIVAEHYRKWKRTSKVQRLVRFTVRCVKHKRSMSKAAYHRHHGTWILSGART